MRKSHSKNMNVGMLMIGLFMLFLGLLAHFGLMGASLVIETPREDTIFRAKSMDPSLVPIHTSKNTFKEINLEERIVYFDTTGSRLVRIWGEADGAAFFYTEELKEYPLFRFTDATQISLRSAGQNKLEIIFKNY